jgi:hypothetical protein
MVSEHWGTGVLRVYNPRLECVAHCVINLPVKCALAALVLPRASIARPAHQGTRSVQLCDDDEVPIVFAFKASLCSGQGPSHTLTLQTSGRPDQMQMTMMLSDRSGVLYVATAT